ncbi:RECEPTOR-LIKE SERINE/THREONINE-PROTEIN KINASE SD1-8 [Salix koriyanagi]|uniref:RECEPTOR-LIKE SERINE/THREONINE-PROTEIN KINASE SD1-8 n=1 Tax=Salix koriyanagi TaxID=2511006 RepID=A0A9Q0W028_9ROSI|nr:RECEPTOR-LIKE SERINE/THREONINE-PROTEIN KINASE SD1-8 [Salix koriyanagi]
MLRVTLVPDGRIELLLWQEINNDWLSLWQWPSNYCDFYAQCSPFSSCDPKGSKDHCKCLPGFQPKVQQEGDMRNWTGGTCDFVGSDLYIRLHDRDLVENVKKSAKFTRKKTHPTIIAVAAVSIGLLGVLCGYFIWRKSCGKQERIEKTCTGMSTSFEIGKIQGNSASKVSNLLDFFSSSLFYCSPN